MRRFLMTAMAGLLLGGLTIGCESLGLGGGDNDDDDDALRDDRVSRGGGLSDLPARAERVEEGVGTLSFRAYDDGTAYVVDQTSGRIIDTVELKRGDELRLDPSSDDVLLNGKDVYDGNVLRDNRHAIHFLPR